MADGCIGTQAIKNLELFRSVLYCQMVERQKGAGEHAGGFMNDLIAARYLLEGLHDAPDQTEQLDLIDSQLRNLVYRYRNLPYDNMDPDDPKHNMLWQIADNLIFIGFTIRQLKLMCQHGKRIPSDYCRREETYQRIESVLDKARNFFEPTLAELEIKVEGHARSYCPVPPQSSSR
ncbi:hypothetical protein GF351_00375 [Candidatus Woesearchaeota archaeon]|nr:hypothetical protein [Candidatus Woesearchaeota archaeon]